MNYLQEVAQLRVELSSAYMEIELTQATMELAEQQPTDYENLFQRELYKVFEKSKRHLIPKETYNKTIEGLKTAAQESSSKSRHGYYVLGKYEVLQCGDVEKLIKKRRMPDERPMYYVSIEETFDVIKRAHIATGHGGRDRMVKHLTEKYANITKDALKLFKSYCEVCQKKNKRPVVTGVVVCPIISNEFNSRGQVD
ncbi:hypothetical protein Pmani_001457 [Petrolisthes manimaculis]|uniref:KRAB-A domain-containing protein 2 n=1 Tax=Petrolisthes manimaculis TaxID=1843537 RepID=A0AAE1QJF9_9EUCA|nr:hypothetical protein Pmani_001457 [Petrolisthes manimaculis]